MLVSRSISGYDRRTMSETNVIQSNIRTETGKEVTKALRATGQTPAVVYGGSNDPALLSLDTRDLARLFRKNPLGQNVLIDLSIQDESGKELSKEHVITHQMDRDVISDRVIHIDFLRVSDDQAVEIEVPLIFEGTAAGQKLGGVLIHVKTQVKVSCLPTNIPENLVVDVSPLQLGESFHVKDLDIPDTLDVITHQKETLALIQVPREARVAGAEDGAEGEDAAAEGEAPAAEATESAE